MTMSKSNSQDSGSEPSTRIATECAEIRQNIEKVHDRAETEREREALKDAAKLVKFVEKKDRDRRGATPEDKLAAYLENADGCPNCGDETESGYCSFSCMQEDLGEQESDEE